MMVTLRVCELHKLAGVGWRLCSSPIGSPPRRLCLNWEKVHEASRSQWLILHQTPYFQLSQKKKKTQTLKIRIISIFPDRILYQRNAKSYFNDVYFVATVQEIQLSFYSEETSVRLKQKLNTVKPEGDRHLLA